jgi:type IV secretion system protein VirB5
MGSALVHARNWRLACFGSLALVGLSTLGLVYLGAQPKAVAHVIEVDRVGAATYRGPVGAEPYVPSDAVITYHLRRFVSDTREISSDLAVVKRNWVDAYNLVTARGGRMLTAYVEAPEHDPFRRAQDQRVTLEFLSTVRISEDSWQVDWRESTFNKDGAPAGPGASWRAMLRTVLAAPKDAEAMRKNPIGLFVDEFHWDKVGAGDTP